MKIITITNRKGGTAKTETARALAGGFILNGYKVLLIDLDAQRNLSLTMQADTEAKGVYNLLMGDFEKVAELIQKTPQGDIIAASELLYTVDKKIATPFILKEKLKAVKGYDYIIIDTAPGFNALTAAAMVTADGLIIPTQADLYSLSALKEIREETESLKEYNKGLKIYGLCITRYANNRISRDMKASLEAAAQLIGAKVYKTSIRECVAVKEAATTGKSIFDYAPKSNAAKDYNELITEILGDIAGQITKKK